jgi:hypothetical protein
MSHARAHARTHAHARAHAHAHALCVILLLLLDALIGVLECLACFVSFSVVMMMNGFQLLNFFHTHPYFTEKSPAYVTADGTSMVEYQSHTRTPRNVVIFYTFFFYAGRSKADGCVGASANSLLFDLGYLSDIFFSFTCSQGAHANHTAHPCTENLFRSKFWVE